MNTDKPDDCCSDQHCNSGRRNRFFPNKRYTPDTWQVEQDYYQQRRRLINRAVHGCGVVYGFALERLADGGGTLKCGGGMAFDPCGRELVQVGTRQISPADCLAFGENGDRLDSTASFTEEALKGKCVMLKAHYAERLVAPIPVRDPCHCENTEWDHVCETIQYSLTVIDCGLCCAPQKCGLECECSRGPCCPEGDHQPTERGGCRCLCESSLHDPTPDGCTLTPVSKTLRVGLCQGVELACVRLETDRCGAWAFAQVTDACGPRRLVKRNDMLFDLIRGCDLTRIVKISWEDCHRKADDPVDFRIFAKKFGAPAGDGTNRTEFFIDFSREIDVKTLTPDAFSMTVIAGDDGDGWGRTLRVPIVGIEVDNPSQPFSKSARILVDAAWAKGALDSISVFGSGVTRFEITVRGDYLLDCNGQMVDANARGLTPYPSGNGTPGDSFFSTFLVSQMERQPAQRNPDRKGI